MIVEPSSVAALYTTNKPERAPEAPVASELNTNNEGRPEAGRTSETGPAVVTNISAAALETARAVTAPEQTADQGPASDAVRNAEQGGREAGQNQNPRVDVMV